jgi:hypothetical protein
MTQLKKKFVLNEAIDGDKIRLLNEQSLVAKDSEGSDLSLFKLSSADSLDFQILPKAAFTPSSDDDLTRKKYVDDEITNLIDLSTMTRVVYVDQNYDDTLHGASDGSLYRPYKTIQAGIDAAYLSDMYGNANSDFVVIIKQSDSPQYGNNATPVNLTFDPNATRLANGKSALTAEGGKITLMTEVGSTDAIPIKIVGSITISGALTTRVKMRNIFIEAVGGSANVCMTIDGSAGRHYFDNCVFVGKIKFQGSYQRWHDFRNGSNNGIVMEGSPVGSAAVVLNDVYCFGQSSISSGIFRAVNCSRIHSITHSGGTVSLSACGFENVAGLVSTASSGALLLADVTFWTGAAYAAFNKSGSCGYILSNVIRSESSDTLNGTRLKLGATVADAQYIPKTPALYSGALISAKTALDELADGVDARIRLSEKAAANGVATLDANGLIPSNQLPAISITDVIVVADIAARDALTIGTEDNQVQIGDVVIVLDDDNYEGNRKSYIWDGSAYQILNDGDMVDSVNGYTGTVILTTSDIAEGSNEYFTVERARDAAVVDSMSGLETDQAPSVSAVKSYLADNYQKEVFTLTSTEVSQGYIDLAFEAHEFSICAFVDRLALHAGSDYSVSLVGGITRLTFAGSVALGQPEELASGDVIRVTYIKVA